MSERRQLDDQLLEIVDLAIEHDDYGMVLIPKRLLPRRNVDDRQTAVPEPDAGFNMNSLPVGSAMTLRCVHPIEQTAVDRWVTGWLKDTDYSAHDALLQKMGYIEARWARR